MALIICSECGKEFSDKADSCPNCGCPVSFILQTYSQETPDIAAESELISCLVTDDKDNIEVVSKNNKITIVIIAFIIIALIAFLYLPKEIAYQSAKKQMGNEDYISALNAFTELGFYKDSISYSDRIKEDIYNEGIEYYHKADYIPATKDFMEITSYKKSKYYLTLIYSKNHGELTQLSGEVKNLLAQCEDIDLVNRNSEIVKIMKENLEFEDTKNVIMTKFPEFFLEGSWQSGNYSFNVINKNGVYDYDFTTKDPDLAGPSWRTSSNIPGYEAESYKFKKGIYWVGSDNTDRWKEQYKITIKSLNEIDLYCFKNSRTYALHRM